MVYDGVRVWGEGQEQDVYSSDRFPGQGGGHALGGMRYVNERRRGDQQRPHTAGVSRYFLILYVIFFLFFISKIKAPQALIRRSRMRQVRTTSSDV
jgi:hypothetical protein